MEDSKVKINNHAITGFFDKTSIIFLFLSFYFYLILENYFGLNGIRIVTLFLCYVFFVFARVSSQRVNIGLNLFVYYGSSVILYFISFPFWLNKIDVNVYLSTFTALIVISNYNVFIKILKYLIIIGAIIAAYEFFFNKYLFVVYKNIGYGTIALDEKMFGGLLGIFRAKVYFEGPLALSQFAIGASFLLRKNLKYLLLLFGISIFANGRLGILICFVLIILYFVRKYNIIHILLKPKVIIVLVLVILGSLIALFNLMDKASLNRLTEAFNTSNDGNVARMQFWYNGIMTWLDYGVFHKIFGNNGYYESIYYNNAENGWITLLINNGFVGFCYYLLPLVFCLMKNKRLDVVYILILFFCMFIQTFHLGASANLFYWLIIYSFIYKQQSYVKN